MIGSEAVQPRFDANLGGALAPGLGNLAADLEVLDADVARRRVDHEADGLRRRVGIAVVELARTALVLEDQASGDVPHDRAVDFSVLGAPGEFEPRRVAVMTEDAVGLDSIRADVGAGAGSARGRVE